MRKSAPSKKISKKRLFRFTSVNIFALTVIVLLAVLFPTVLGKVLSQSQAVEKTPKAIVNHPSKPVCGLPGTGKARCHAHVVTDNAGAPLASNTPYAGSFGPVQFHTAYALPCTPNGAMQTLCATPSTFGPQTIAIVDAYNAPTIENDLNVYSSNYGLPSCTKTNGCLQVVNQNGGTTLPTTTDSGWALETSLDVEVAHTICQTCKILLVEASSNSMSNLATGVQTAANMGATAISNSYGASEWPTESSADSYYNHPGIAVTVSSGDNGYGASYPAAANGVVAVGGTTLSINTDNSYANESVWNGTGSGCSSYETAKSWQMNVSNWSATGCNTKRGIADVAADADPNTGAAVYDSTAYNGQSGWYQVGGTSLSAPLIASIYALTGGVGANTNAASLPYTYFTSSNSHDVTNGSNGSCSTAMCTGTTGYDGPTGLGTPNGILGFMGSTTTTTPTPTLVQLTPTPISTDTTAPTVAIISPVNGATVKRSTKVTITVNASDNVGVTKVELYVGSTLTCTDTASAYSCAWRVPGARNVTYKLTAVAYDAAGNTASSNVTVTAQ